MMTTPIRRGLKQNSAEETDLLIRAYDDNPDPKGTETEKLWTRRKRGNGKLVCSGCGRKLEKAHEVSEREVRDLPCREFRTTVVVEVFRVCCPDCSVKVERVPQFSRDSENRVLYRGIHR